MGIHIDPAEVTRAGNELLDQSAQAKERVGFLLESTVTVVSTHSGWDTAGALDACRQTWHRRLNALVDQTGDTAEDVVDSAGTISAADSEAADRLTAVLDELAGP